MQTKSGNLLAFLFGEHFNKVVISKKLYAAVGLLLLASVLLFSIVGVIQEKNKQHNAALQSENRLAETAAVTNVPTENRDKVEVEAAAGNETPNHPVKGKVIMAFGWQEHPVYKDWRYHTGVDIGVGSQQDIQAVFSGRVSDIYIDKHNGLTVVVESRDYKIFYGALSTADVVKDSYIKRGQSIGKTGVCRDQPKEHLYVAVKKGEHYIDPVSLF